jgi:hypothetical protein
VHAPHKNHLSLAIYIQHRKALADEELGVARRSHEKVVGRTLAIATFSNKQHHTLSVITHLGSANVVQEAS